MFPYMNTQFPSPKPPDPPESPDSSIAMEEDNQKMNSFKEIRLNKGKEINLSYSLDESDSSLDTSLSLEPILLTEEEKVRIYQPWKNLLIVKLFGEKIVHSYLKNKLTEMWKPTESLSLIDFGWDFYIAKFN